MEAGGVEPPSEKRSGPKPTCLSHSIWFAGYARNAQDALPASPIDLAGTPRTEVPPASLLCDASIRARRRSSGRRATLGFSRQPEPTRCWQFCFSTRLRAGGARHAFESPQLPSKPCRPRWIISNYTTRTCGSVGLPERDSLFLDHSSVSLLTMFFAAIDNGLQRVCHRVDP